MRLRLSARREGTEGEEDRGNRSRTLSRYLRLPAYTYLLPPRIEITYFKILLAPARTPARTPRERIARGLRARRIDSRAFRFRAAPRARAGKEYN